LNRVRQQVIQLLHGYQGKEPEGGVAGSRVPGLGEGRRLRALQARVSELEDRLSALEERAGTGPDTADLDEQIAQIRREREAAVEGEEYEQAASLRDREKQLLADKAARRQEWSAAHPDLPSLAERLQQLSDEVARLRALLDQGGTEPGDKTA
jgi:DNA repair exonuclease SbcCD ATPase subunit